MTPDRWRQGAEEITESEQLPTSYDWIITVVLFVIGGGALIAAGWLAYIEFGR